MKCMVSACLLGENCKYNGGNNRNEALLQWLQEQEVIPVCPEVLGGLSTPRPPAELVNGVVRTADGTSVDTAFRLGAEKALYLAQSASVDCVILQSRSPSCGVNAIYDGSFSGRKIEGSGVFASLLQQNGIPVCDIEDFPAKLPK